MKRMKYESRREWQDTNGKEDTKVKDNRTSPLGLPPPPKRDKKNNKKKQEFDRMSLNIQIITTRSCIVKQGYLYVIFLHLQIITTRSCIVAKIVRVPLRDDYNREAHLVDHQMLYPKPCHLFQNTEAQQQQWGLDVTLTTECQCMFQSTIYHDTILHRVKDNACPTARRLQPRVSSGGSSDATSRNPVTFSSTLRRNNNSGA